MNRPKARETTNQAASVVIPVLNDATALRRLLADLRNDPSLQLLVVDGGSSDDSLQVASAVDAVYSVSPGRGQQLHAGAIRASGPWLWFLHADSRVSPEALESFASIRHEVGWGWFDVRLDGAGWLFRVIETAMNWRAALTGIATGDQGIFVHRQLLDAAGGVPVLPLMEDVALCKRLRRLARPRRLRAVLQTSARRWQRDGIVYTVLAMWALRLRYFFGADAQALASRYYGQDDKNLSTGCDLRR